MNRTFIILCMVYFAGIAYAQPDVCQADLAKANDFFRDGDYTSAQQLVTACLQKDTTTSDDRVAAFKILGKIGAASGDVAAAKTAFTQMLKLKPLMTLNPAEESPEVIQLFNEARVEFFAGDANQSTSARKDWPWIAVSGAVIVVIAGIIIF